MVLPAVRARRREPCRSPRASRPAPVVNNPPAPVNNADLTLAARLYKGDARTPAGFDLEARPSNVVGTLSTRHLKNTDLATGIQAISRTYEVCTNDMAQAVDGRRRRPPGRASIRISSK